MRLGIKIDPAHGFDKLRDRFVRIMFLTQIGYHARLDKVLERMEKSVKDLTPRATGVTAEGWERKSFGGGPKGRSGYLGVVRNRRAFGSGKKAEFYKKLLMILEYGSVAHVIVPKTAQLMGTTGAPTLRGKKPIGQRSSVLTFKTHDGQWISKHLVHHPGTRPYGMVRLTAAQANYWLRDELKAIADEYAKIFGGA
jgi:hypothetical protein